MAYEIEDIDSLCKNLILHIPQDELQKIVNKKLRKLQKTVKIHGFRKGKVPMSVMKQRYSGGAYQEAIDDLLQAQTQEALGDLPVIHLGRHQLTPDENGDLTSKLYFELKPDLDPTGYLGLEVDAPDAVVTEEDLLKEMQHLQTRFAVNEPIEDRDTIEAQDVVIFDQKGIASTVDDLDLQTLNSSEITLLIQEDPEKRHPIENEFLGASKSEPLTVVLKLSDMGLQQYGPEETATLEITIHSINKQILPKLNDELALETGLADTYEELENVIREHLQKFKDERRRAELRQNIAEKIVERHPIQLPPKFLQTAIDHKIRGQLSQFGFQNSPDLDVEKIIPDIESVRNSLKDEILKTHQVVFLAETIFNKEGMKISQDEFSQFVVQNAQAAGIEPQKLFNEISQNPNLGQSLSGDLRVKKALDFLADNAEINTIPEKEYQELKENQYKKEREERMAALDKNSPESSEEE